MHEDLKFSVITVCLNSVEIIKKTCESIQQQRYKNFEWIVIDGLSSDGTLDILKEFHDSIDILISEKDSGIYNAMNKGIAKAKGEYLVFMNAGDCFFDMDTLNVVNANLGADIVYGDTMVKGSEIKIIKFPKKLSKNFFLKKTLGHQSTYFKRSLFEQYKAYDESFRIAGDYELFVRFFKRCGVSSHHVGHVLCQYYFGGISSDPNFRKLRKTENHYIRWKYFPKYRISLKSFRQLFRNRYNHYEISILE